MSRTHPMATMTLALVFSARGQWRRRPGVQRRPARHPWQRGRGPRRSRRRPTPTRAPAGWGTTAPPAATHRRPSPAAAPPPATPAHRRPAPSPSPPSASPAAPPAPPPAPHRRAPSPPSARSASPPEATGPHAHAARRRRGQGGVSGRHLLLEEGPGPGVSAGGVIDGDGNFLIVAAEIGLMLESIAVLLSHHKLRRRRGGGGMVVGRRALADAPHERKCEQRAPQPLARRVVRQVHVAVLAVEAWHSGPALRREGWGGGCGRCSEAAAAGLAQALCTGFAPAVAPDERWGGSGHGPGDH